MIVEITVRVTDRNGQMFLEEARRATIMVQQNTPPAELVRVIAIGVEEINADVRRKLDLQIADKMQQAQALGGQPPPVG